MPAPVSVIPWLKSIDSVSRLRAWYAPFRTRHPCRQEGTHDENCVCKGTFIVYPAAPFRQMKDSHLPTLGSLLIVGPAASGKTLLAQALVELAKDRGLHLVVHDEHTEARPRFRADEAPPELVYSGCLVGDLDSIIVTNATPKTYGHYGHVVELSEESRHALWDLCSQVRGNPVPVIVEALDLILEAQ